MRWLGSDAVEAVSSFIFVPREGATITAGAYRERLARTGGRFLVEIREVRIRAKS